MDRQQFTEYSDLLMRKAKGYNGMERIIKITLTLPNSRKAYLIKGRESQCRIIFDPLNEASTCDVIDAFVARTEEELDAIIGHIRSNPDLYLSRTPGGEDVHDRPDILITPYNESDDSCWLEGLWVDE